MWTEPLHVLTPASAFTAGQRHITLRISGENFSIDRTCQLLGPFNDTLPSTSQGADHALP